MINKDTFKWFIRGFILTSLLLLAIVIIIRPMIGWAQGGSEEKPNTERQVVGDAPSHAPGTDDPAGRAPVIASSVVDSGEPRSNEAMAGGDAPLHAPGTDDLGDITGIGTASEITVQSYSSPLVIPAADFRNDGDDPDGYFFYPWGGYIRGKDPATDAACMMAPAYLPHGATVTRVCAYLYDNDGSYDAYAELQRVRNASAEQETMASVSTSGTGAGIQFLCDETISPNEVDNLYSYYVTTCLYSTTTRLWAIRIFYTGP